MMETTILNEIEQLAELLRERNDVARRITQLIGRPAQIGHVGEWIASKMFDIELELSAVAKGIDGRFRSGPLRGKSVNVKFYAKHESVLAIREVGLPDYYLVLAGPRSKAMHSRGDSRPLHIDYVFLFDAHDLCDVLRNCGTAKIDECATSIRGPLWERAEIHPLATNAALSLDESQRNLLRLFSSNSAAP